MTRTLSGLLAAAALLPGLAAGAPPARSPRYGPPPAWVAPLPVPADRAVPDGNGIALLLLDHQMSPARAELYVHDARKLTNASGVQRGSRLSFGWDPSYETLTLHSASVVREGRRIDALLREKVRVLEREAGMAAHLYDGSLTAVLILEDVRPGDVVEYAYTLRGANPVFGGKYLDGLGMRGSSPWAHVRYRLLWPKGRELFTRAHGDVPPAATRDVGAFTEHVWEARDVPPLLADSDLPSWFDPWPWVQLSEFATWKEVALWAVPLYAAGDPGEAVRAEARRIAAAAPTARERAAAALRFVQEEVRYVGLEMGTGSYRPNPPREVLGRRFGDCKDKALLLVALLGELGVAARPALVDSDAGASLDAWHPSPLAFDHVVVRAEVDGRELWLDPTRTRQGGAIEEIWFPPLHRALLVDPSTEALETIPVRPVKAPLVKVVETWTVPSFDAPASFRVTTTHRGPSADAARSRHASSSPDAVEKGALEYYTERYPGISKAAPIAVRDDPQANIFEVTESYSVKGLFAPRKGSRVLAAWFYPQELRDVLPDPGSRQRTMPLGLSFPERVVHEAVLHLPAPWSLDPHDETVATEAFRFRSRASATGSVVRIAYEWETLADSVPAASAPEALARISKVVDSLGWELTHDPDFRPPATGLANLNVPAVAASLLLAGVAAAGAVFAFRWRFRAPPLLPRAEDLPLSGLGGWLVLVGFGCVVRPLTIAFHLATGSGAVFLTSRWTALASPGGSAYHPAWAPILLGELFGNVVLLVLSILTAALFFAKKRAFPHVAVGTIAFTLAFAAADAAAIRLLPETALEPGARALGDLGRAAAQALVWVPYFTRSRRVKATFLR